MQVPVPTTPFETAVGAATTSWLGTGGASYRVGGEPRARSTPSSSGSSIAKRSSTVGLFDERLIRNQDYELNIRLRNDGRTVWFDPELQVGYRPRGSWRTLAKQYYEYGYWKMVVMRMHPRIRPSPPDSPAGRRSGAVATFGTPRRDGVLWR